LISLYRAQNSRLDLFGNPTWAPNDGVVGVTIFDGLPIVGTNTEAPTYSEHDKLTANQVRDAAVAKYPEQLATENLGRIPNNAFYHAEATVLFRTARANGGSLFGRELTVHTDTVMCSTSCPTVLPILGLELGNPRVTFVDPRGERRTMHNGKWE